MSNLDPPKGKLDSRFSPLLMQEKIVQMVTAFHLFDKDFHQLLGLQALYRRASAKQSLGDLDGAMEDLKSACELFGKPRFEQKGGG